MQMLDRAGRGFLKAGEVESVFRAGLDEELGLAMASRLDGGMAAGLDRRPLRVLEATYRIAARLPADADSVPSDLIDELDDLSTGTTGASSGGVRRGSACCPTCTGT